MDERRNVIEGRRWVGAVVFLGCCSIQRPVHASDAYDDDRSERTPEDDAKEETSDESSEALEVGGLRAPDAMPERGDERTDIERELDEADEKDAGRGFSFVWVEGQLGVQLVGLATLSSGNLAPDAPKTSGSGLSLSAGGGVRLLYFTGGARFRYGFMGDYDLMSILAEVGLRVPLGSWEPHADLGLGYSSVLGFEPSESAQGLKAPRGFTTRIAVGADYFLSDSFSVGLDVGGDLLFLKRRASDPSDACTLADACPYLEEGSSTGAALFSMLALSLHF